MKTVSYLERQLAAGQAFVERVGAENVNRELLVTEKQRPKITLLKEGNSKSGT